MLTQPIVQLVRSVLHGRMSGSALGIALLKLPGFSYSQYGVQNLKELLRLPEVAATVRLFFFSPPPLALAFLVSFRLKLFGHLLVEGT